MNVDRTHAKAPVQLAMVLIVDPCRLSREAMQHLLGTPFLTVVGAGATLRNALQQVGGDAAIDLIIYNFGSDTETEQELRNIQTARAQFPGVRSVILTDCLQPALLLKAVHLGIEAFLSRDISVEMLRRALELVLLGQHVLPTTLARLLLDNAPLPAEIERVPDMPPPLQGLSEHQRAIALSRRERQILQCLVEGRSNKTIARELDITEATVKVHIKGLLRKTQMTNRTQAAVWALNNNIGLAAGLPAE